MSDSPKRNTRALLLLIGAPIALVAIGLGVMLAYFASVHPGEEIATTDVSVGEPFELRFDSPGESVRVWLDFTCTECAPNALTGQVVARAADGKELAAGTVTEPVGGYSVSQHTDETKDLHEVRGHPFLEIPATPEGTEITVTGKLDPEPRETYRVGPVTLNDDIPLPEVSEVRVWVAP